MSRICKGKGPFTCPSCDWNENCKFAWSGYDEKAYNKETKNNEKDNKNEKNIL